VSHPTPYTRPTSSDENHFCTEIMTIPLDLAIALAPLALLGLLWLVDLE
jgi:hypothetical protein